MCFVQIVPSCEIARQCPVWRGCSKVDTDRERKCITRGRTHTCSHKATQCDHDNYTEPRAHVQISSKSTWHEKRGGGGRKDERGGGRQRSGRSIRQQRNVISMNLNKSFLSLSRLCRCGKTVGIKQGRLTISGHKHTTLFFCMQICCTEYTNECSSQNVQHIKHITPQGKQCVPQCNALNLMKLKQYQSQFLKTPEKSKLEFVDVRFGKYFNISLSGKITKN